MHMMIRYVTLTVAGACSSLCSVSYVYQLPTGDHADVLICMLYCYKHLDDCYLND